MGRQAAFCLRGPHQGARISRIHNVGIANIPPECTFVVMLSSDMCLAPDALEQIARLHQQHPRAVIITRLDWLPPLTYTEIEAIWDGQGYAGLSTYVPTKPLEWVGHTLVGTETRPLRETATLEPFDSFPFHPVYGLPIELYWRVGGFDEGLIGYGWHELELGTRLQQQGVSMITTMEIRALHIWHSKDAEIDDLVPWQRQKNTAYMLRKHGPHPLTSGYRNWKYWRHYHRLQGGKVIYAVNETPGLYAVNDTRSHYLHLPHAGWLHPLGFSIQDVTFVHVDPLAPLNIMGAAEDPLDECDFSTLVDDLNALLAERLESWQMQAIEGESFQLPMAKNGIQRTLLQALFLKYDVARTQADSLPGANLPVIGVLLRVLIRTALAGKVWAAERQFLQAVLEKIDTNRE